MCMLQLSQWAFSQPGIYYVSHCKFSSSVTICVRLLLYLTLVTHHHSSPGNSSPRTCTCRLQTSLKLELRLNSDSSIRTLKTIRALSHLKGRTKVWTKVNVVTLYTFDPVSFTLQLWERHSFILQSLPQYLHLPPPCDVTLFVSANAFAALSRRGLYRVLFCIGSSAQLSSTYLCYFCGYCQNRCTGRSFCCSSWWFTAIPGALFTPHTHRKRGCLVH